MGRFIGRKSYLKTLSEFYGGNEKALSIFGRRRVGKTRLIEEFVSDKPSLYIQFLNSSLDANLQHLGRLMSKFMGRDVSYQNTEDFFWDLSEKASQDKIVIVFDEFPYMVECDGAFASRTQNFIDHQIGCSKLILCGSSIRTMRFETDDYSRPLYGRTRRMQIKPMSVSECIEFHPGMSDIDQIRLYLTIGGIPYYHSVPEVSTYAEYLEKYLIGDDSIFGGEGEVLINSELSPSREYIKLLDAMTGRRNDIKTISDRSGIDRNRCSEYLEELMDLGIVDVVNPMLGAPKKPKYYFISDNIIAFHFGILRRYNPIGTVWSADDLRSPISTLQGHLFEVMCMDALRFAYPLRDIGAWWGKRFEGDTMEECDIDIVSEKADTRLGVVTIYTECKMTQSMVGFSALNELDSSMQSLRIRSGIRVLMSASGFSDDLIEYAKDNGIVLIGPEMILGKDKMPDL